MLKQSKEVHTLSYKHSHIKISASNEPSNYFINLQKIVITNLEICCLCLFINRFYIDLTLSKCIYIKTFFEWTDKWSTPTNNLLQSSISQFIILIIKIITTIIKSIIMPLPPPQPTFFSNNKKTLKLKPD